MIAARSADELCELTGAFLQGAAGLDRLDHLRAQFDAGLAWVHYPVGLGGLGLAPGMQSVADEVLRAGGAPRNEPDRNPIGIGMAAPTLVAHGTEAQLADWLRPLWTGEEIWCQLFSEHGAGSDLAGLATRARAAGDSWIINGHKVWTSLAHDARWGLLIARTDPTVPKHRGLTYFVCDMRAPGVDVRPLRQATGEAEFNEVYLDDVRIPDRHRLGDVGEGWRVTGTTLGSERVAISGGTVPRESGAIGSACELWRERPEVRTAAGHDELMRLWVDAEAARLANTRLHQQLSAGTPGPEGSAAKLVFARLNQDIAAFELELGGDGLGYDDWHTRTWKSERPDPTGGPKRGAGYRYLRARANSIEGGTSEVMRNIIAERVLGLPAEQRTDTKTPWIDLPR